MSTRNTTTIRITKEVKWQLDQMFDPRKHTYSGAIEQLMSAHRTKWNFLELYIAVVATIVLVLVFLLYA